MQTRALGTTGFRIAPFVFGGNVFGWTVDERTSFALLDRLLDAGVNAIDTADCYSAWVPGNAGGESEAIIGRWLARTPSNRDRMVLITKVGYAYGDLPASLAAARIAAGVEGSLRRLQVDCIDVYFAHIADPATPIAETLGAFQRLIEAGKVRAIGASNYSAAQLREARAAAAQGLPRYAVLEPEYNLYDRAGYEAELRDVALEQGLGVIPYFALASGFLTGKYRSAAEIAERPRAGMLGKYFDARGLRILAALDAAAAAHRATPAAVALAWLATRPGVTAPIASATSLQQLDALLASTSLSLRREDLAALESASA